MFIGPIIHKQQNFVLDHEVHVFLSRQHNFFSRKELGGSGGVASSLDFLPGIT